MTAQLQLSDYDDSESDLTDLEDLDKEFKSRGTQVTSGKKKRKELDYKVMNPLKTFRSISLSAHSLNDLMTSGLVNLNPGYQRDVVWPESKQSSLIDSLMRNYYVPPVIFFTQTRDDGSQHRICIDGKQRLTSIRNFMSNKISLKDPASNKKYWYQEEPGRRQVISKGMKQNFDNKQIVCVEYDDLTEEQEREIFQRVQMGMALTPAERLSALSGEWADLARHLRDQVGGEGLHSFNGWLDWGQSRGQDFRSLATILYMVDQHPTMARFPTVPQLERWLQKRDTQANKWRPELIDTFKIFAHIAKDEALRSCFDDAKVSSVEFPMIGVLIWMKQDQLSLEQLSHMISGMRKDLRSKHSEIRMNAKVSKTLWTYITIPHNYKTETSAVQTLRDLEAPPKKNRKSRPQPQKRKRDYDSDEYDEEEVVEPAFTALGRPRRVVTSRRESSKTKKPATRTNTSAVASTSKAPAKTQVSLVAGSSLNSGQKVDRQFATRSKPPRTSAEGQSEPVASGSRTVPPLPRGNTASLAAPSPAVGTRPSLPTRTSGQSSMILSTSGRLAPIRAAKLEEQSSKKGRTPPGGPPAVPVQYPPILPMRPSSPSQLNTILSKARQNNTSIAHLPSPNAPASTFSPPLPFASASGLTPQASPSRDTGNGGAAGPSQTSLTPQMSTPRASATPMIPPAQTHPTPPAAGVNPGPVPQPPAGFTAADPVSSTSTPVTASGPRSNRGPQGRERSRSPTPRSRDSGGQVSVPDGGFPNGRRDYPRRASSNEVEQGDGARRFSK